MFIKMSPIPKQDLKWVPVQEGFTGNDAAYSIIQHYRLHFYLTDSSLTLHCSLYYSSWINATAVTSY